MSDIKGHKYFIADDTIVGGIHYRFVYGTSTDTMNFIKYKSSAHLIREDSNRRVFIKYHKLNLDTIPYCAEILLYDFSMLPGDTITYYESLDDSYYSSCSVDTTICILDSIDTVMVSGIPLRRYSFTRNVTPHESEWYEGIGCIDRGLFGPFCDVFESGEFLGCYIDSSIYLNLNYAFAANEFCSYLGAEPIQKPNEIQLFPNPVSDKLTIRAKTVLDGSYLIYNSNGVMVGSGKIDGNDEIDFSSYSHGIYLVRIVTKDNQQRSFKIVRG